MKSKHLAIFLIHLVAAVALVVIWFKAGYIYGGGDVGLPTYNPSRILDVVKNVWWESSAPGFPRPQGVTAIPLYTFLALGQKLGLSELGLQAGLYGLLLVLMFQGVYWLSWEVLGRNRFLSLLSSFIYVFHPNLMIQVWHRFVQTAFYFAAALPFLLIFWNRWIQEAKKRDLVIFLIISIFTASIFSTFGFLITFWIILGLHWVVKVFIPWQDKQVLFSSSKRFGVGLLSWFAVSLWWLWPIFAAAPAVLSAQHTVGESVANLLALSSQTIAPYTLQGINPYYLFYEKDWGEIYSHPVFLLIPWLITAGGVWGAWQALKDKRTVFWGLLLIIALGIAKGAAAPFGNAFTIIFSKFFVLGVLRNPFEKVGIIIPLAYAILIPLGLARFKPRIIIISLYLLVVIAQIFVWGWPFWTGKMFGTAVQPAYVKVPESYGEVDRWLAGKGNGGRILHLPLTSSEAIAYKWIQGYKGVEPSQLLFTSLPSWSQGFNLQYVDDLTKTVQLYLRNLSSDKISGFEDLLQKMNIKYIVLHMDVLPNDADVDNPIFIRSVIENLPFLKLVHLNGDLVVYEITTTSKPNQEIVFSSDITTINFGKDNKYWPWLAKAPKDNHFISQIDPVLNSSLIFPLDLIVADRVFTASPILPADINSLLAELPPIRILPFSKLYPLIAIKEKMETPWIPNGKQTIVKLKFAGKRLVEAVKLVETGHLTYIPQVMNRYQDLIGYLFSVLKTSLPYNRPTIEVIFARHLKILELLEKNVSNPQYLADITNAKKNLRDYLAKYEIIPQFDFIESAGFPVSNRLAYGFNTRQDRYRVLVPVNDTVPIPENISLQIDESLYTTKKIKKGNFWDVGEVNLTSGYHEISYSFPGWQLPREKEMTLTTNVNKPAYIDIPLTSLVNGAYYTLNFEYWIQKGDGFLVQLNQDSDVVDKKGKLRRDENFLGIDAYNRYWKPASVSFKIRDTTRKAYIKIQVDPWDDCRRIILKKDLCENVLFKQRFQRPTQVVIRSLIISQKTELPLFLESTAKLLPPTVSENKSIVDYQKLPPVHYLGNVNTNSPGMLFLRQTYAPGWVIKLKRDGININPKEKYLIDYYANGWWLDQPGNYEFEIYYSPQQDVKKGLFIGVLLLSSIFILPKSWYEKIIS